MILKFLKISMESPVTQREFSRTDLLRIFRNVSIRSAFGEISRRSIASFLKIRKSSFAICARFFHKIAIFIFPWDLLGSSYPWDPDRIFSSVCFCGYSVNSAGRSSAKAVPRTTSPFGREPAARHVMDAREGGTFWKSFLPQTPSSKTF